MNAYFDEIYAIECVDADLHAANADEQLMMERLEKSVQLQSAVHDKYWINKSRYYAPSSMGSHPEHDWSKVAHTFVLRTGDDTERRFLFLYEYPDPAVAGGSCVRCYSLRAVDGKLMIDHTYF